MERTSSNDFAQRTNFAIMKRNIEQAVTTWAHARVEVEAMGHMETPGADRALALINRIMLGETPSQILPCVRDQELVAILNALEMARKARNTHFNYESTELPDIESPEYATQSSWSLRNQVACVLEIYWFVRRSSKRLMGEEGPGTEQARRIVHRISVMGEDRTVVVNGLESSHALSVLEVLDRVQND